MANAASCKVPIRILINISKQGLCFLYIFKLLRAVIYAFRVEHAKQRRAGRNTVCSGRIRSTILVLWSASLMRIYVNTNFDRVCWSSIPYHIKPYYGLVSNRIKPYAKSHQTIHTHTPRAIAVTIRSCLREHRPCQLRQFTAPPKHRAAASSQTREGGHPLLRARASFRRS